MSVNFYQLYNLINENIESNFDVWFDALTKYAKNYDEKQFLEKYHPFAINLVNQQNAGYVLSLQNTGKLTELKNDFDDMKSIIVKVLKEQNLENLNWLGFCLGYRSVKKFRKEDLEMAIEVTKKAIDSGELLKSEIGAKGWFSTGKQSEKRIAKYLEKHNELSKREIERRKKRGEADLDEEELVRLIVQEDKIKIYYLPRLKKGGFNDRILDADDEPDDDYYEVPPRWIENNKQILNKRHQVLCKLGKDTSWCTAQPSWDAHESYITDDIYIIHENDRPKYQFVSCINSNPDSRQFMDTADETIESLTKPIFNLLNKHLKEQISCYKLKIFLESIEDLEKLENLNNVDFLSINRMISGNSNKWIEKMPFKQRHSMLRKVNNVSVDPALRLIDQEEQTAYKLIEIYDEFAKKFDLEQDKKNDEKLILRIYEKLLNLIDDGLKNQKNSAEWYRATYIIDNFETNLSYHLESLSKKSFIELKKEIKKRKNKSLNNVNIAPSFFAR